jgi:flagellar motor switch protein FliN/FliY
MNQMIGSAATSLSNMLKRPIDITPPIAVRVQKNTDVSKYLDGSQLVVKVSFDMEIEGMLKSKIMQLMTIESSKEIVNAMMGTGEQSAGAAKPKAPAPPVVEAAAPEKPAPAAERPPQRQEKAPEPNRTVNVKPIQYPSFEDEDIPLAVKEPPKNIDLISDIPLQVAVELGKTQKNISEILNMGIGSVIVLDKLAGELVEVVVNGKYIARGEVVVIDENYGVRITDIFMGQENNYIALRHRCQIKLLRDGYINSAFCLPENAGAWPKMRVFPIIVWRAGIRRPAG